MNTDDIFTKSNVDMAWCPGCGNFAIIQSIKKALLELTFSPTQIVVVSGIGQAAKTPHYFNTNMFNGLHGRALPVATAIKAVNPELIVIAECGDGDMYGEGGNHFLHAIRRNPNITVLVHNNMVYGLTKGQASPTSGVGFKTQVQIDGVIAEPFNPLAVAIAQRASFVARAFAGDIEQTKEIIKAALQHEGFALVDIFQPCVTFNKVNTYAWFKEHIYYVKDEYNAEDKSAAFALAMQNDRLALGIIYRESRTPFEKQLHVYHEDKRPLYLHDRSLDLLVQKIGDDYK